MAKTITFDHAVIYNGTFYPAGASIEVKTEKPEGDKVETEKPKPGKKKKEDQ